jgi:small basic protein
MIVTSGFSWVQLLTLLVSVILPILVALATNRLSSPGVKAVVLALLAALVGFLSELLDALVDNTAFNLGAAVMSWVTAFIIAVASHYGLLKPTGLTGSKGAVAQAVPGGLGTPVPVAGDRPTLG